MPDQQPAWEDPQYYFARAKVYATLTAAKPKLTEGSDVLAGVSLDQLYAQQHGTDTPIPSIQLCIENVDGTGACGYGYACVYADTISWAAPNRPLPNPRSERRPAPAVSKDSATAAGAVIPGPPYPVRGRTTAPRPGSSPSTRN